MILHVLMTQSKPIAQQRNRLLDLLDGDAGNVIAPHLTFVELAGGRCISELSVDRPVVCFPLSVVVSAIQSMADGTRFEIGVIGAEGVVGWPPSNGDDQPGAAGVAQLGGGTALVVPASVIADVCVPGHPLHSAMLSYMHSFGVQMRHTIVANLRDGIERRLARWLLMLHDRIDGDVLTVTHGELAATLNVRRASITDTLHVLEGERVVRCTRGSLTIRDRPALTAIAGDSYGPAEASYRALIGDFGKT